MPAYIESLPAEVKRDARYLSKFVVGAGFGLFDYSLNAIWNEVVIDLRRKAISYGVDIFFDSAVGGKARDFYKSEEDLGSLKDAVLLDTCRKLELIADTTYKKLKHILEMRNDIGISHPTNYTINAFELLGWLQTCIQDVLNDRPTEAALQVQAFINNLRTYTSPLEPATRKTIETKIKELASHHLASIIRTAFGIYVSPETDPQVRKNISVIAPVIWANCADDPKYKSNRLAPLARSARTLSRREIRGLQDKAHRMCEDCMQVWNGTSPAPPECTSATTISDRSTRRLWRI